MHRALSEGPWALMPDALASISAWARDGGTGALALGRQQTGGQRQGVIVVLPIHGVIEHRADPIFGGVSVESLRGQLAAAVGDADVRAVVLDIDSPGGSVAGMTELAADVRAARGGKPIVAVANTLAASAAYWLAAQAQEVSVTPSGSVGSVGVYAIHQDYSRALDEAGITTTVISAGPHKVEGNEFQPLTEEAREAMQERVDAAYAQFVGDVALGRGRDPETVEADFGGGRTVTAQRALDAGMVDRIETLGQAITRLATTPGRRSALAGSTPVQRPPLAAFTRQSRLDWLLARERAR